MKNEITYLSAVRYAIKKYADADPNEVISHNDDLGTSFDVTNGDVVAKLNALAESLDKRAHAIRKPTAKQKQAMEARNSIPERMERGKLYTASEVGKLFGESTQWATPKVNALAVAGVLTKTVEKGKSYYSLA